MASNVIFPILEPTFRLMFLGYFVLLSQYSNWYSGWLKTDSMTESIGKFLESFVENRALENEESRQESVTLIRFVTSWKAPKEETRAKDQAAANRFIYVPRTCVTFSMGNPSLENKI